MVQMALDLVLIGVLIRVVSTAARKAKERRVPDRAVPQPDAGTSPTH
jgi:hypothetical protein